MTMKFLTIYFDISDFLTQKVCHVNVKNNLEQNISISEALNYLIRFHWYM